MYNSNIYSDNYSINYSGVRIPGCFRGTRAPGTCRGSMRVFGKIDWATLAEFMDV